MMLALNPNALDFSSGENADGRGDTNPDLGRVCGGSAYDSAIAQLWAH